MNIKLHHKALFRVPQFSTNATLEECWPELKLSIKDASSYFYNTIKDLDYQNIEAQSQNIKNTIAKYFNRARFRATPYGTFASIGTVDIMDNNVQPIVIPGDAHVYSFRDWSFIKSEVYNWREHDLETLTLQINTTYYEHNGTIRYLYFENNKFELSEITNHPEVSYILNRLKDVSTFNSLIEDLPSFEFTRDDWRELVSELIEYQLIFTDKHPAIITGDRYSHNVNQNGEEKSYKIGVQRPVSGALSAEQLKSLTETVNYLNSKRLTESSNTELEEFIQKFQKRYDQQAVPIMKALDPMIGIGYGKYATVLTEDDLVQKLNAEIPTNSKQGNNDSFKKLLNSVLLGKEQKKTIQLETFDLPDSISENQKNPNTFSALIKITGDFIHLSQLGGVTANALLGRFTLASEEVHLQCQDLAAIEQNANPDILFFDVAYAGEPDVDNINRRQSIYDHTTAIHNYVDGTTIDLTDVYLKVIGSELILFSKKQHKRLIPRIATAYNYTRSDLPLFRLLCDLQRQGLISNLKPDLQSILPGLEYLPRLQYKQVIISLRAWLLKYDPTFEMPSCFLEYLKSKNVDRYIQVGSGDQTLRLDMQDTADIALLVSILKLRNELWAEEHIIVDAEIINDPQGSPYSSEFIISYYHQEQIYTPLPPIPEYQSVQRTFYPGSEWLYFEIYVHPESLTAMFKNEVSRILKAASPFMSEWFFIRYNENGDHLRLRIKLKDITDTGSIITMVFQQLDELLNQAIISDIKICTYTREVERYAFADMESVEHHFYIDSNLAIQWVQNEYSPILLYPLIHSYCMEIGIAHFGLEAFLALIIQMKEAFAKEHNINKEYRKQINKTYEKQKSAGKEYQQLQDHNTAITAFKASFIRCLNNAGEKQASKLFADLFHMHVNRIFTEHQRLREYIIYEYLYKLCLSMKYE